MPFRIVDTRNLALRSLHVAGLHLKLVVASRTIPRNADDATRTYLGLRSLLTPPEFAALYCRNRMKA